MTTASVKPTHQHRFGPILGHGRDGANRDRAANQFSTTVSPTRRCAPPSYASLPMAPRPPIPSRPARSKDPRIGGRGPARRLVNGCPAVRLDARSPARNADSRGTRVGLTAAGVSSRNTRGASRRKMPQRLRSGPKTDCLVPTVRRSNPSRPPARAVLPPACGLCSFGGRGQRGTGSGAAINAPVGAWRGRRASRRVIDANGSRRGRVDTDQ